MRYMRLGELLIQSGAINEQQLAEALASQKVSKLRLGEELMRKGQITETQLMKALGLQLGIDCVDLTAIQIPVEVASFIPQSIAKKYLVVPFSVDGKRLNVAMYDPMDFIALEEIKAVSQKRVNPFLASRKAVERAIMALYGSEGTQRVLEEMKQEATPAAAVNTTTEVGPDAAPTIRFVNSVIERAFQERASDIHLEPQDGEMVVRMRIDGRLRRILEVPANLQSAVISRLKIIGDMNISERRIPQDGHAMMTVQGRMLDLRINTMPTVYGEKVVLRLLDKSTQNITKQSIGLEGDDLRKYDALLQNSSGVILIVGPTGSGKSTTLFTMIRNLTSEETNIVTLEDPVEYNIPGVSQCQINEKTGMTFAAGLRAILRQDPDIISVGEIRDGETGSIAIRAAITGHLVLSTLHTNDAASTFARLRDIGVEPYLTASAMRGVISQRLVRRICPHCRKSRLATELECKVLELDTDTPHTVYEGAGCSECGRVGYRGRIGTFEILTVTRDMRNLIASGANTEKIAEAAIKDGMVTMRQSCARLVLAGITTVEEAMKAINSAAD